MVRAGAIKFHWSIPSLRLILAWVLFRAIDFFTATMIAIMVIGMIVAPIAAAVWIVKLILQFVHFSKL